MQRRLQFKNTPYSHSRPFRLSKGQLMRRLLFALGVLALAASSSFAQTSTWNIDPAHSGAEFAVTHMSVSTVRGKITGLKGAIVIDDANIAKSSVSVTIDVGTVDTGVSMRDNDLKSPNFFEVAKFPTASFASTSVSGDKQHLTVNGNLTLHGVTRPVVLEVDGPTGPAPGMDHKPHAGYTATTTLNRKDFGIGAKYPDSVVSDQVKLTIDLEVAKQ
jgi:polyisoprenoid-binding protein YceI